MKTVLTLAVGFWIGRQVYVNYNKSQAEAKESAIRKELEALFKKHKGVGSDIKKEVQRILNK